MTKVVGVIIAVLIAVLVLPLAVVHPYEVEVEVEIPDGWQYDDYEVASADVDSVSGSLELVEIAGVNYIHANDVGEGTITYTDSTTETVTVNKAILDFYCVDGQSNGTYRQNIEETDPSTATPYPDRGDGYFIDMLTSQTYPIAWFDENGDPNVGNIPPSFVSTYYEETHHKVLFTMAGVSGRSITAFQPGEGHYNRTLTAMENAYLNYLSDTEHYIAGKKVLIWIQGEADNDNMTASEYYNYFMNYWNGINSDSVSPFDYCMISYLTPRYDVITAADKMLIENNADIYLGSDVVQDFTIENGYLKPDGVHYSQAGRNVLGVDLAENGIYLLSHQKSSGYNPFIQSLLDLVPVFVILVLIVVVARVAISARND